MQISFRSQDLPGTLSEAEQIAAWQDFVTRFFTSSVFKTLPEHRLDIEFQALAFGGIHIGRFRGTMASFCRHTPEIEKAPLDDFMIGANIGTAPLHNKQAGRETTLQTGEATFATVGEPGDLYAQQPSSWLMLGMPRSTVQTGCPAAENLIGRKLKSTNPGLRHLLDFLQMIVDRPPDFAEAKLLRHIEMTLINLVIVTIENERDLAAISDVTTTRAEQLRKVYDAIQQGFSKPDFSIQNVVRQTKLSERYIRSLMAETETTFSKRLLEIRLRNAYEDLRSPRCAHMKIGDVALACGFEDISNFNRKFRAHFKLTPSEARQTASDGFPKDFR